MDTKGENVDSSSTSMLQAESRKSHTMSSNSNGLVASFDEEGLQAAKRAREQEQRKQARIRRSQQKAVAESFGFSAEELVSLERAYNESDGGNGSLTANEPGLTDKAHKTSDGGNFSFNAEEIGLLESAFKSAMENTSVSKRVSKKGGKEAVPTEPIEGEAPKVETPSTKPNAKDPPPWPMPDEISPPSRHSSKKSKKKKKKRKKEEYEE